MFLKIAVYTLVLIFALPLIAIAVTASIAILVFLARVGVLIFFMWVVWTVFSYIWQKLSGV